MDVELCVTGQVVKERPKGVLITYKITWTSKIIDVKNDGSYYANEYTKWFTEKENQNRTINNMNGDYCIPDGEKPFALNFGDGEIFSQHQEQFSSDKDDCLIQRSLPPSLSPVSDSVRTENTSSSKDEEKVAAGTVIAALLGFGMVFFIFLYVLRQGGYLSKEIDECGSNLGSRNENNDSRNILKSCRNFRTEAVDSTDRVDLDDNLSCDENQGQNGESVSRNNLIIDKSDGSDFPKGSFLGCDSDTVQDESDTHSEKSEEILDTYTNCSAVQVDEMTTHVLESVLDEKRYESKSVLWKKGGGPTTSIDIESCILCDAVDWLKRSVSTDMEERKKYFKSTLNKVIGLVRLQDLKPEDASHIIHECATLLDLPLATELSDTTIIVTGMVKKCPNLKEILMEVFGRYGDIEDASVAPYNRGFGIVRYKTPKSVRHAMEVYRSGEIEVQDVEVTVSLLKSFALSPHTNLGNVLNTGQHSDLKRANKDENLVQDQSKSKISEGVRSDRSNPNGISLLL